MTTSFEEGAEGDNVQILEMCDGGQTWSTTHGDRVAFRAPQVIVQSPDGSVAFGSGGSNNVIAVGGGVKQSAIVYAGRVAGTSVLTYSFSGFQAWPSIKPGSMLAKEPADAGDADGVVAIALGRLSGTIGLGEYVTVQGDGGPTRVTEFELADVDLSDSSKSPSVQRATLWSGVLLGLGAAAVLEFLLLVSKNERESRKAY